MGVYDRILTAVRAGVKAYQGYNEDALAPLTQAQWDDYSSRLFRYNLGDLYYFNVVFTRLEKYAAIHRQLSNHGLYKQTRAIYNPIGRLCDMYPAKIYGGQLDMANLTAGAIPIVGAHEQIRDAIRQLWRWSNWQTGKSLFVNYGARLGDVAIKIVDERDKKKVRMELLHPGIFQDVKFDAVGNVKSCIIAYQKSESNSTKSYTYEEHIDGAWFKTFKDGKPYAFYNDASGNPVSEWANEYGFVPVAMSKHRDVGMNWGMSAGQKILGKVDELSSLASRVHDQIAKVVNPVWAFSGVSGSTTLEMNDEKSVLPILKLPAGATAEPLVFPLDIMSALEAIREQLHEIERDTPELALHRLREGGNLTAPGVRAGYSDAIDLIGEAAGGYDATMVRAHMMGITIGGIGRYPGFEPFNANSYQSGNLEHNIGPRAVIDDSLSEHEKIQALLQLQDNPYADLILSEMGFTQEQLAIAEKIRQGRRAEKIEEQAIQTQASATRGVLEAGRARNGQNTGQNGVQNVGQPAIAAAG